MDWLVRVFRYVSLRTMGGITGSSNLRKALWVGVTCVAFTGVFGACKQQKGTAVPDAQNKSEAASDPSKATSQQGAASLEEKLRREGIEELRPFDFEQGRLKGQAALLRAPKVEALDSGAWVITGEYAPDGGLLECLVEPDLFPLGEKMGRFLQVALDDSEKIGDYRTSVGELFLRQSKYSGLSQVVVYELKQDPSTVGFYTLVATHGDGWTLACAADSPGYFQTMVTATTRLADSIVLTPDEKMALPKEHSIYELRLGGQRIGLQEHNLYRLPDGGTMQLVEVLAVGGKPNESFQVRSQYHLKSYQGGRLDEGLVMQYVNGKSLAEYSYREDAGGKKVQIKDLKQEGGQERAVKLESPLWNEDQLKACLRDALAGKASKCRVSSGALDDQNQLSFDVSTMKVKNKKDRVFSSSAKSATGVQWFDEKLDSTRTQMSIVARGQEISVESVRIWPQVESQSAGAR